ncbi:MAG TPA: amino acid ABC transporter ATP-binding protein [Candidatus Merdivicinus excrementipullorum]|uniref:Amino acid ABC transporter ATP-binding protein n=1 Tax=Candidatus Merdivicinus excrementipullorum TaxID=2840867 RepID=A0A9D1FLU3_9FIRM|nr:amino acid ABC transporter ATP-binding protein [Candidatus Merdivicinus excrementipullorum]
MIEVEGLKKSFGTDAVIDGVSFSVEKGQTVAVIGPSGAGKSTMLRCLINLETADGGTIQIEGQPLLDNGKYPAEKVRRQICAKMGMVFQNFNLFPHLTVLKNLTLPPLNAKKMDAPAAEKRAKELLKKVGLEGKENARPSELSGGQKQRVAIARALMMGPDVLLFDEPTSALDPQLTGEVLEVIRELSREHMTMIVVTHEMGFAREAADKILFMGDHQILEEGTPEEIFNHPKDPRISEFVSKIL